MIKPKIVIFIALLIGVSAFGNTSFAANLTINCDVNGHCSTQPVNGKLFSESGLLPGDSVTRTLTIKNHDKKDACLMSIKVYKDFELPPTFANNIFMVVREGTVDFFGARDGPNAALPYKNLDNLYTQQTLNLGPLAANSTRVFDWTATFNSAAGNELQNAITQFDLKFVFECKHSKQHKIKITKHHNYHWFNDKKFASCTIEIRSGSGNYHNALVVDAPPYGYKYVKDSWNAVSNKRGNLKSNSMMREPRYGSPGDWEIGDLAADEVITLTYELELDASVEEVPVSDLAWVSAESPVDSSTVLGESSTGDVLANTVYGEPAKLDNSVVTEKSFIQRFRSFWKYLLNTLAQTRKI